MSRNIYSAMQQISGISRLRSFSFIGACLLIVTIISPCLATKNHMADYAAAPPFVTVSEKPAVMLLFDNSASMHEFAYQERNINYNDNGTTRSASAGFNSATTYYGYFDNTTNYTYDSTNKYFYVNSAGDWNGNFLNWLFMKREDVAKKVLTGGVVDSWSSTTVLVGDIPDDGTNDRGEYKVYNDSVQVGGKYMTPYHSRWVVEINTTGSSGSPGTVSVPGAIFYAISSVTNEGNGNGGTNKEEWKRTSGTAIAGSSTNPIYVRLKVGSVPTGIVQNAGDKIRFGLTIFDSSSAYDGGVVKQPVGALNSSVISSINSIYPDTNTPLGESLYTVVRYFAQASQYYAGYDGRASTPAEYTISNAWDPYWFADKTPPSFVPCSKSFVIIITDGEPTMDTRIPSNLGTPNPSDTTSILDDVAHYAHLTDLRSDLAGAQNLGIYAIQAFGSGSSLLQTTAINGGYVDVNHNGSPNTAAQEAAATVNLREWDFNKDGLPDNYTSAASGQQLEDAILNAINSILARVSSASAASVISNSRSGEGAVYQAVFYPLFEDASLNKTQWAGEVHALMLDSAGNMREDTNQNGVLDLVDDLIIVYNVQGDGTTKVLKYKDANGNGVLDTTEAATPVATTNLLGIKYLWNSSNWLNEITDANVILQRTYASTDKKRYIITSIDANRDGIPEYTLDFVSASDPSAADLTNYNYKFFPYLHTHPPFVSPTTLTSPWSIKSADLANFKRRQTRRVIEYIRGKDQAADTTVGTSTIPAFRSRQADYTGGTGTAKTWRLGDIVYSTPTAVGTPSESFDMLYKDNSYKDFHKKYLKRRTVIYTGANDGMIHAFNGGFYKSDTKTFAKKLTTEVQYDLGAELWAYVPFNLLPHLYWLTDPNYPHVYYMDMKPRVFDAKIFTPDATHPHGWGTVMVCGMRLGGGVINADINKNDTLDSTDPVLRSAFVVMDITDPESPPRVMAELSFPELGFTTSYPTVLVTTQTPGTDTLTDQNWFLVLGSGPIDEVEGAGSAALSSATSTKSGKIYMVNLVQLADTSSPGVWVRGSDASHMYKAALFTPGSDYFASLDDKTFISDIISVDSDLDYNANVLYFGTVRGNQTDGWGGKLRRIVVDCKGKPPATCTSVKPLVPSTWLTDSTLLNLVDVKGAGKGQPITAAPAAALDNDGRFWVFFGTGRFFNRDDVTGTRALDVQSYYGVKEPISGSDFTWATVPVTGTGSLADVTNVTVFQTGATVTGVSGVSDFNGLVDYVKARPGWRMDFSGTGERNLGQAAVLGGLVMFSTYTPCADYCTYEGTSDLYAPYYKTGSAYKEPGIGVDASNKDSANNPEVLRSISLGQGLTTTPNIGVPPADDPSADPVINAYIQQSTGGIEKEKLKTTEKVTSHFTGWKEE